MQKYAVIVRVRVLVDAPNGPSAGIIATDEVRRAWEGEDPAHEGLVADEFKARSEDIRPYGPYRAPGGPADGV